MLNNPNPLLNDEEAALLADSPEECLRRAVGRAALSLDEITVGLPSQVAAAIRGIVTGERPAALRAAAPAADSEPGALLTLSDPQDSAWVYEPVHSWLAEPYPRLDGWLSAGSLTPDETMSAVQKVDATLGRYPTGARYAAP
jgi:hypothetical protein